MIGQNILFQFFTVDSHSVFWLYLRKPAGDSWGILAGDPQQYSLTPCKIQLVINFVHPKCYLVWGISPESYTICAHNKNIAIASPFHSEFNTLD